MATVKHYAVHSGPESLRHRFNAVAGETDLRETYLPQFHAGVVEAGAFSVMCAYNRFEGDPCCGSNRLLSDILRDEWKFDGYVVSDCGAIKDIYDGHAAALSSVEASAMAVKAGCDLCCGTEYAGLKEAVERGLITEKDIDVSVGRLMTARFRLGMFDPPGRVPYARIPYKTVDSKKHRKLALEAARQSIVLLKNENGFLPLDKKVGTLAVIGPNADDVMSLLGNYYGSPFDPVTPLRGIREKASKRTKVLYARGCDFAEGLPSFDVVPSDVLFTEVGKISEPGLRGEYFPNREFAGRTAFVRTDPQINFNWFEGAPRKDMDGDRFSIRWSGRLVARRTGRTTFATFSTVQYRVALDDSVVLKPDAGRRPEASDPRLRVSRPIELTAGRAYALRIEAIESSGDAQFNLLWSEPRPDMLDEAVETAKQADVVVLCLGLSPRLEGEQMQVDAEGFSGGDRLSLDLPSSQTALMRSVHGLGKPVVLVLLNGGALGLGWAKENIHAIVETWYPGQAGGRALADVLFGDCYPSGRLPVTFYRSAEQLPWFEDYGMKGRTYRFFEGECVYPFGHGLTYTEFKYSDLKMNSPVPPDGVLEAEIDLANTGSREGDEVVQLYIGKKEDAVQSRFPELKGFRRVHLGRGEKTTVRLRIPADRLSRYDPEKKEFVPPSGEYLVRVGTSCKDIRAESALIVTPRTGIH